MSLSRHLTIQPSKRRILICEDPFWPEFFPEIIAEILLLELDVPEIGFINSLILPVFTTGGTTALVIDCGYSSTKVECVSLRT